MSVKAIYEKLTKLPTIIGLDNEVLLIEELQKSEIEWINVKPVRRCLALS